MFLRRPTSPTLARIGKIPPKLSTAPGDNFVFGPVSAAQTGPGEGQEAAAAGVLLVDEPDAAGCFLADPVPSPLPEVFAESFDPDSFDPESFDPDSEDAPFLLPESLVTVLPEPDRLSVR
jgi:hypothetical protein